MARKSRKAGFVNMGKAAETAAVKEEKHVFRAGLYARLSLESGANRERGTIENQMGILKKFVEGADDIVVESEYMDVSKTGTNFERDGFEEMMRDIRDGRINCVIVKDLSRLGRNYVEAGNYVERVFPFFEVRFISVTDGYDSIRGRRGPLRVHGQYFQRILFEGPGEKDQGFLPHLLEKGQQCQRKPCLRAHE